MNIFFKKEAKKYIFLYTKDGVRFKKIKRKKVKKMFIREEFPPVAGRNFFDVETKDGLGYSAYVE